MAALAIPGAALCAAVITHREVGRFIQGFEERKQYDVLALVYSIRAAAWGVTIVASVVGIVCWLVSGCYLIGWLA